MSYIGILVSAIASMIIGSLWYGPLFGKQWLKLSNFTKQQIADGKKRMSAKLYFLGFLASLLTAYVLGGLMGALRTGTIKGALLLGSLVWLGFYVTTLSGSVLWEGKPFKLYLINIVYWLVTILSFSAILFYL